MSNKLNSSKVDVINVKSNDVKMLRNNNELQSIGKDIAITLTKAFIPIAIDAIKKKIAQDQETQKLIRDDKRLILNKRAETLISQIEREETKEEYDQDRINRWCDDLEDIMNKLDLMDAKSESFIKGALSTAKEFFVKQSPS